jgi:hypothetical protein
MAAALVAGIAATWPSPAAAGLAGSAHPSVVHARSARFVPQVANAAELAVVKESDGWAEHAAMLLAMRHAAEARQAAERLAAARRAAAAQQAAQQAAAQQAAAQQAAQQAAAQQAAAQPSGSPQQIALGMLGSYGWSDDQFSCLDSLWNQESGWNVYAENPTSGAYGIPQALPGDRMASAGPDWQTDAATQISWGLSYIQQTYGSPCGAWDHEEAYGWY